MSEERPVPPPKALEGAPWRPPRRGAQASVAGADLKLPEALGRGRLAANVMHFARALRAAGLPLGPGRVLEALKAVEAAGLGSRQDLYWTLHSVFVNRRDQRELFDQCFHVFWRDPKLLERLMHLMLPQLRPDQPPESPTETNRRVADALAPERRPGQGENV